MLELASVIVGLRAELDRARQAAANEELRFEVGSVELEVSVAVEKQGGGGGKVRFWVVELGGDVKATQTATQRVKLTLQPRLSDSSAPVEVAGKESERER